MVDYGFWGGVVPGNTSELTPMWETGALGFKCFLSPSGVDDFENVSRADLEAAAPVLSRLGAPLLVHAEDPALIAAAASSRRYGDYLASRPPQAEVAAIEQLIDLSRRHRTRTHIVHLATEQALPAIVVARKTGVPVTTETCPHYLTFSAEQISDGQTLFKCAPPIRSQVTWEHLWAALEDGAINLVASDHSPCPPALKCLDSGDFSQAWGGISSLQLSLSAVWTGAHTRGFTLADIARWMSTNPAKLAGLEGRKGRIAPGYDADLVAFDPNATFVVDQDKLYHRHKHTPYHGLTLRGKVDMTFLRGRMVCGINGSLTDRKNGQWLKRVGQ
jgi:allantoinase